MRPPLVVDSVRRGARRDSHVRQLSRREDRLIGGVAADACDRHGWSLKPLDGPNHVIHCSCLHMSSLIDAQQQKGFP